MKFRLMLSLTLVALCTQALAACTVNMVKRLGPERARVDHGDYAVVATGLSLQNAKDVQAALEKIAGAKEVKVDAEKGAITVTMKDDLVLKQSAVADVLRPFGAGVTSFSLPADQEVVWMLTYNGGGG